MAEQGDSAASAAAARATSAAGNGAAALTELLAGARSPGGHYDEVRDAAGGLRPHWRAFARHLPADFAHNGTDDFARHERRIASQLQDNGVTYNVHSAGGARPWSLDVLPHIVPSNEWELLAAGLKQRAHLLEQIARDLYGPQRLICDGVIPPDVIVRHAGFLRQVHGVQPAGDRFLHVIAFDVARRPDGGWEVWDVRAQAPSGSGYALENRLSISQLYPDAFRDEHVHLLAPYFRTFRESLLEAAPCPSGTAHIVLLTPGPFNETYVEHAYLARYLGFTLVEGADLDVRDDRVFLKTVDGLRPVHGILRRLDDDYSDPLELRAESTIGVPGLVQAWRARNVLLANALGMSVLESPALNAYLPAVCQQLLHEPLAILSSDGGAPLSHAPAWAGARFQSRAVLMRVFLAADGQGDYIVMHGGLTRIGASDRHLASGQRDTGSKDTWVLSDRPVEQVTLLRGRLRAEDIAASERMVSSRAAEHLFWMGRYAERSENTARLMRAVLTRLHYGDPVVSADSAPIVSACRLEGLLGDADEKWDATTLEQAIIRGLSDAVTFQSVAFDVEQTLRAAGAVRDRLSTDNWRELNRLAELLRRNSPLTVLSYALDVLDRVVMSLVAVGGLEMAHMTRDAGWRFLTLGRHLERLSYVTTTVNEVAASESTDDPALLEWLLDLSDSIITYRARYMGRAEWLAVADLLLFDPRNPRSAVFQLAKLAKHVVQLPDGGLSAIAGTLEGLAARRTSEPLTGELFPQSDSLPSFIESSRDMANQLSDALTLRYFSHVYESHTLLS